MEHTPSISYNADFGESPQRFNNFYKKFYTNELIASKKTATGTIQYRYHDGAVLLNGKGLHNKDRINNLLQLFSITDIADFIPLEKRGWWLRRRKRLVRIFPFHHPQPKEVSRKVPTLKEGKGIIIYLYPLWLEVFRITEIELVQKNGRKFTEQKPMNFMAKPGYIPMIKADIDLNCQGHRHALFQKRNNNLATMTIYVNPATLRVYVQSPKKFKRSGRGKTLFADIVLNLNRAHGITEPLGAAIAGQLPKLLGI